MGKNADKNTARAVLKKCWKWSWLATLPVAVVFCLWAVNTASAYRDFKLRYSATMKMRLVDIGSMQAGLLLSGAYGVLFPPSGQRQALTEVHLYINEADIRKLDSDLPYSGMEFVKGRLLYPDGKLHKVKVRYRGDFSYHWSGRKKSIRIKTGKDQLYDGMRQINLIIPKTPHILGDYLSYTLAGRLGLMAPGPRLVEVYINGKYMGVELMVEQPEEQFLRRHSRMPGDLYKGEIVGRDLFPGLLMEVFYNPEFWTKDAINNHNPPEWNEAMKRLTRMVYTEDMDGLLELIDVDSWAALAAFMTISQTVHIDYSHNWRLYFDPAKGRFFPVVWDPLGWHLDAYVKWLSMQSNRMDVITSVVFERLHRDHRFLRAKHEAIEAFFAGGGDEFLMKAMEDTRALEASISKDRNLHFNSTYLLSPGEVLKKIAGFKEGVRSVLQIVRKAYMEEPPSAAYAVTKDRVQINIDGFTPIKSIELELKEALMKTGPVTVEFMRDGQIRSRAIRPAELSPDGRTLRVEAQLYAARTMSPKAGDDAVILRDARITPATYWIRADGIERGVTGVRAVYAGGMTADIAPAEGLPVYPLDGSFHAVPVDEEAPAEVWAGEVNIEGVREVGALAIRPGTTVRLKPGASVVVRGRLTAEGEAGRPVRFIPAREGQAPWGAVVLAGRGAGGSTLKGCEFSGGSGLKHKLVEYSAMLSIHDVKGVEITGCSFSDSHEVDDMVHAVYSELTITGSEFRRSKSDALDLDYVKGRVVDSRFHDSGNDALDLMSSQVAVLGSLMSRSGDKGISVGEGAEVFVWNTSFTENEIGLQSKDGSQAIVHNSEFTGNKKTIDAYKKNWQYGDGGHVVVSKSRMEGASPAITADKDSSVSVYDSYLAGETGGKKKRVLLHETVDSADTKKARTKEVFYTQATLPKFMAPFVRFIDPKVRGLTASEVHLKD
ncbi:MAG: CotH kinase family protein [Deltaproteobacteria bacterium]|nr:CotH kinase family protein [Deltaproteobacteria bacterium]